MTLGEALERWRAALARAGCPEPERDALLIAAHVLGLEPGQAIACRTEPLPKDCLAAGEELVARRACRIPLQYVLGECEFYGLRLLCDPRALIPRPETELLVDVALKYTPLDRPSVLADLGTGSGCLAIAVAVNRPLATILAVDISQDALDLAQANARLHGAETRIRFFRGDLVAPLVAAGLADSVEGVLANLPYVAEDEYACLQPEVHYEPRQALVSGPSGVEAYAKLAAQLHVLPRLRWAALELPATRAQCILGLFRMDGWEKELIKDYSGFDRVLLLVREP